MVSWKVSAILALCVVSALVIESESRRGNRRIEVLNRRGNRQRGNRAGRRPPIRGRRPRCRGGRQGRNCRGQHGGAPTQDQRERLMASLSRSVTAFSWDVYREMAKPAANVDNFVFSPYSVFSALTMAMLGARGRTKREMKNGLNLQRRQRVHQAMNIYNATLAARNDGNATLSAANAIYLKPELTSRIKDTYTDGLRAFYNSAIQAFQSEDPEEPINAWVEEKTEGMIEDFLDEGTITQDTAMMLINAVYFKGLWKQPFDDELTDTRPFHVTDSQTEDVEMMFDEDDYKVKHSSVLSARILELPYAGDNFALYIILPDNNTNLNDVAGRMTADGLTESMDFSQVSSVETRVKIPKFKLDTNQNMKEILHALNFRSAFSQNANFRGMFSERTRLTINEVIHRTVIELDEEGTRAAAATGLEMMVMSMRQVPTFYADRPFMFVLRDVDSGMNLFMGRFSNPGGQNVDL